MDNSLVKHSDSELNVTIINDNENFIEAEVGEKGDTSGSTVKSPHLMDQSQINKM